jgi:riboflavin kinase
VSVVIEGVLRDGLRVAAGFTELPWVREQFRRKLGLEIWPGTVNLEVRDPAGLAALARLRAGGGVPIEPPPSPANIGEGEGGAYCVGRCFPARIGPLPAAVVVPHVPDYPADKLELVAPVRVRDALHLEPGDRVVVTVLEADGEPNPPAPFPTREGGVSESQFGSPFPHGEGGGGGRFSP